MIYVIYICSENKDKAGDKLTGNHIINLKVVITNIEIFIVWRAYLQEENLQIRREKKKRREKHNFLCGGPLYPLSFPSPILPLSQLKSPVNLDSQH